MSVAARMPNRRWCCWTGGLVALEVLLSKDISLTQVDADLFADRPSATGDAILVSLSCHTHTCELASTGSDRRRVRSSLLGCLVAFACRWKGRGLRCG
jgi:hypothetical protein